MSLSCSHCTLWWLWRWLMLNKKMKNVCWEQRPKSPPITCRVRLVLWFWLSLPQEIQECFWALRLGPLGARKSNQFRILEVFENWKEGVWVRSFCRVWLFDLSVVWSTELLRDDKRSTVLSSSGDNWISHWWKLFTQTKIPLFFFAKTKIPLLLPKE